MIFRLAIIALSASISLGAQQRVPTDPIVFGAFKARFAPDGAFILEGQGWPPFKGTWKAAGDEVEIITPEVRGCAGSGRYRFRIEGTKVVFGLVADECRPRRMILDGSVWRPEGEAEPVAVRRIVRTGPEKTGKLPSAADPRGSWPSFRGPTAAGLAIDEKLPETWDVATGKNILWKVPIPGLAHSSPVVWGKRIFVTTAISTDAKATFKPGLYGDGDASEDRSRHRWMVYCLEKETGKTLWERVAFEGEPVDKRHIKSTYASSTPATDGRIVVAWFGSQGVCAYDVNGSLLWKVDLGRLNLGAYDIPTYEWGPASSPIIWKDLVILQCDTQGDSFILALKAATGEVVWKTERDELPSWGTPTVVETSSGPEIVTNAANYVRGYDPRTGKELWRLGRSSKITAPTPIYSEGLIVVASGRAPERPIFAIRPGARGDITLAEGESSSKSIAWSRTGRGSYMPTPLIYDGILYVLANNGVFDAYDLKTGAEIYRQRLEKVGSGFSASPVAAGGRIYLSSEDGDILVIEAGRKFRQIVVNPVGEMLMATPAISDGVMYVRSSASLIAIK